MEEFREEQKWDGFSTPISDYILLLFETLQYYKEVTDVRLEIHATIGSTCDFLEILFYEGINSLPKYERSENVKNFLKLLRARKCISLEEMLDVKPKNQTAQIQVSCAHDFSVKEFVIYGPNDIEMIYQMSFFLRNLLKLTLKGNALLMINQFEMGNKNGIDMFKRLLEVYGRTPEHTAKIPWLFDWSNSFIE